MSSIPYVRRWRKSWRRLRAAVWALVAVYMKQSDSTLAGSGTAAWLALLIAFLLVVQTAWLKWRPAARLHQTR